MGSSDDWGVGNLDLTSTLTSLSEQASTFDLNAVDVTGAMNSMVEHASKVAKDIADTVDSYDAQLGLNVARGENASGGDGDKEASAGGDGTSAIPPVAPAPAEPAAPVAPVAPAAVVPAASTRGKK